MSSISTSHPVSTTAVSLFPVAVFVAMSSPSRTVAPGADRAGRGPSRAGVPASQRAREEPALKLTCLLLLTR